jgi:hypothetical protein
MLVTKPSLLPKESPLERLPDPYISWENTADILPKLISQILDEQSCNKESRYLDARKLLENLPSIK